ncbi:hypothetical protein AWZ03_013583 [Drosophila navojoa]|uniref:Uncharacterized protein n=1 Tax=Drosophila navojoa TaxID=7232 RepID=A0A484AWJ0_DRONA|nr:hypothetical protein AWZ03_013583 [Drosophila navojoa]
MKSVILYPYGPLTGGVRCCRMLHAKNLAITSAIYTINISLLIVLIYSWRINVNMHKSAELQDVYYGVQIAYFAIIGTQMSMILLSIVLIFGICREEEEEEEEEEDEQDEDDCRRHMTKIIYSWSRALRGVLCGIF